MPAGPKVSPMLVDAVLLGMSMSRGDVDAADEDHDDDVSAPFERLPPVRGGLDLGRVVALAGCAHRRV